MEARHLVDRKKVLSIIEKYPFFEVASAEILRLAIEETHWRASGSLSWFPLVVETKVGTFLIEDPQDLPSEVPFKVLAARVRMPR